tara:strand:+ start:4109 stop:4621 length:513 start_codon:yes stop_codon:yes gene_type:complete
MIKYEVEVDSDGSRYWYLNGQYHREDGPALELYDGSKYWYLKGKRHREDGPAIEDSSGSKYWLLNGRRHREDGPAIEWCDGSKFWFLNGQKLTEAGHKLRIMTGQQHQTDLVDYMEGLSKGAELAKKEMKQKIEEKLQLWEAEGYLEVYIGGEAVAASDIYDLITEEDTA